MKILLASPADRARAQTAVANAPAGWKVLIVKPKPPKKRRRSRHWRQLAFTFYDGRLTDREVDEVRTLHEGRVRIKDIAARYGVSYDSIASIVTFRRRPYTKGELDYL
jgi:DNA-binding CsgD family transcriptional regulator